MRYDLGDVRFLKLECREGDTDTPCGKEIRIGGNLGDVHASGVSRADSCGGVVLHNVVLVSSTSQLSARGLLDIVEEIVYATYASIGEETFTSQEV